MITKALLAATWISALGALTASADDACKAEIKAVLAAGESAKAVSAFKMGSAGTKQIWFFDTADAQLLKSHGLILRIRRGNDNDVTVKVRPKQSSTAIQPDSFDDLKCESDMAGPKVERSYSLSKKFESGAIPADGPDLKKLLTASQLKLIDQSGAKFDWAALKSRGPIQSTEWETKKAAGFSKVALESWAFTGMGIDELSTKVAETSATEKQGEFNKLVNGYKLKLDPAPISKTARVLSVPAASK